MKIDIITAFPAAFSYLNQSIPKRAQTKALVEINIIDLRQFGEGKWKKIDDRPFGGGVGMLLQVEPIYKAVRARLAIKWEVRSENEEVEKGDQQGAARIETRDSRQEHIKNEKLKIKNSTNEHKTLVLLTSARGANWTQSRAEEVSKNIDHLIIICGHYEGVDHRVIENLINEEVSIGNYILSGGELASMVIVDSVVRLVKGVVGKEESIERETTFYVDNKEIEHPHYTRPEVFKTEEGEEWSVPDVLLSGNHAEIEKWKQENTKVIRN